MANEPAPPKSPPSPFSANRSLDISSVAGLSIGLAAVLIGQLIEGSRLSSLAQLTAAIIVFGGTAGAVMLQSSPAVFLRGIRLLSWVLLPPRRDPNRVIGELINWNQLGRRNGLLSLDQFVDKVDDPFVRKALQLAVDGQEETSIRAQMELELATQERHLRAAARIWDAAGGYAPTLGILGAVLGLIHVMESLSDPTRLGAGIAVAFVATVYGVGAANLLFIPIGNKLRAIIAEEIEFGELILEGLLAVVRGDNSHIMENHLRGFLARD